jgi:predicted enzyme related to lactoylglutathione lyase
MINPVTYFEIPVQNLDRAVAFYQAVFGFTFQRESIDGNQMALFPFHADQAGASGALAKGPSYKPSKDGTRVYFDTIDIDRTLSRAIDHGARLLYPKTAIGSLGYVAEFQDPEGNRIALHMTATTAD